MLAVLGPVLAILAQSGAGTPALQKAAPASVLQPSVGLLSKEPAGTGSPGQSHKEAAASSQHKTQTTSSAAKVASSSAKVDAKAASEERRAAAKVEHDARKATERLDHEARYNRTAAPHDIPAAKALNADVKGGGGHEPKAVSVVTAIMLLSSLTFACITFYLVNWPNAEIVKHSWSAISVTICIFCAVLIFNASNGLTTWMLGQYDDGVSEPPMEHESGYGDVHQQQEEPHHQWLSAMGGTASKGAPDTYVFILAFVQFLVWFCVFALSMVYFSGVAVVSKNAKNPSDDEKHLNAKAGSMLLCHVAGFAAINAFGVLMRMAPFYQNAWMAFLSMLLGVGIILLCVLSYRKLRTRFIKNGTAHDQHLLEHEAEEGGEDMVGLVASFLIVQVLRFGMTGVLPDGHGGEPDDILKSHDSSDVGKLIVLGYFSAAMCAVVVVASSWLKGPRALQAAKMTQITLAMIHCWCLYFSGVWMMAASDMAEILDVYEDSALLKVILACLLTVYAFVLIFALEKLASFDCTGPKVDNAIVTIMGSLGILIGFTWEQSFERSVSTVVQASGDVPAPLLKGGMAIFLVAMVLPAWRMFIMKHTMEEHHKEQQGAYEHDDEAVPVKETEPVQEK